MRTDDATPLSPPARRHLVWPGLILAAAVIVVSALVIASGRSGPSEASDQDKYHLVVIETMVEQWPDIDIVNYQSATSPGYHALMATIDRAVGTPSGATAMRFVNAILGSLIPLWCYIVARRFTSAGRALALAAPVAVNSYIVGGSAYLTTDNAGLLLALIALGLAVGWPAHPLRTIAIGTAATLAVATRQVHLWVAGAPLLAALAALPALHQPALRPLKPWFQRTPSKQPASLSLTAVIAFLAPAALVAYFVSLWGGLVPPAYAAMHNGGANFAGLALAFGLAGIIAPALSLVATPLWRSDAYRSRSAALGAAIGLIASLASPTTFQMKERALGWLWHGVWLTPDTMDRSILLIILAPIGGAALGMMFSASTRHGRGAPAAILMICIAGWMMAQSMNSMAWQRYFEPMLLVTIAWLAAMSSHTARETRTLQRPALRIFAMLERAWWVGPAALITIELGVTAITLFRELLSAPPVNF